MTNIKEIRKKLIKMGIVSEKDIKRIDREVKEKLLLDSKK